MSPRPFLNSLRIFGSGSPYSAGHTKTSQCFETVHEFIWTLITCHGQLSLHSPTLPLLGRDGGSLQSNNNNKCVLRKLIGEFMADCFQFSLSWRIYHFKNGFWALWSRYVTWESEDFQNITSVSKRFSASPQSDSKTATRKEATRGDSEEDAFIYKWKSSVSARREWKRRTHSVVMPEPEPESPNQSSIQEQQGHSELLMLLIMSTRWQLDLFLKDSPVWRVCIHINVNYVKLSQGFQHKQRCRCRWSPLH